MIFFGKSKLKAELASLEHAQQAEDFLIRRGLAPADFSSSIYISRAARIGHLRGLLGYIPNPGTFLRIDYEIDLQRDTIN